MICYTVTIWDADDTCAYLATNGALTTCEACALRFADPASAEAAAIRNTPQGGTYMIEQEEI